MVWSQRRSARTADCRRHRARAASVCLAAGTFLFAGCSSALSGASTAASMRADPAAPPHDGDVRAGEMHALSARSLVSALNTAGFAVPNPLDTTAQDCSADGCQQSIVTDTLRVESFATTAQAQQYAAERGFYQVETVVVSFAPPLPETDQVRYRTEIRKLVP